MATFTFVKKGGAPAGTINIQIGNDNYVIDDSANTTIVTTDPQRAHDLGTQPYLNLQGVTGAFTPAPVVEQLLLVDGAVSKPAGNGTYTGVSVGGGGSASVTAGGNLAASTSLALSAGGKVWLSGTLTVDTTVTITGLTNVGAAATIIGSQDSTGGHAFIVSDGTTPVTVPVTAQASGSFVVEVLCVATNTLKVVAR